MWFKGAPSEVLAQGLRLCVNPSLTVIETLLSHQLVKQKNNINQTQKINK